MAALDLFEEFTGKLTEQHRSSLAGVISERHADLLAARSEEARVRIVHDFIDEVRERRKRREKPGR
ncbi:MAG: hypothetical protein WBG01_10475 [Bacteroidota bacterium]